MFALSNGLSFAIEFDQESGSNKIRRQAIAASLPADSLSRPVKYVDSISRPASKPFLRARKVGGITFAGVGRANFSFSMSRK